MKEILKVHFDWVFMTNNNYTSVQASEPELHRGPGGVLVISLGEEVLPGPSYPDPV